MLHQMLRVRWTAWKQLTAEKRAAIALEASNVLAEMEREASGQSAIFSLLGHKGDLILVHFRRSFDELNQAERKLAGLEAVGLLRTDVVVFVGGGAGAVRIQSEDLRSFGGTWDRSVFAGMDG